MSDNEQDPSTKIRRKACTECRQQKARCDSYLDSSKPCSRCKKLGKDCVVSDPFKRENKRQRLSELQSQTLELQQQLEAAASLTTGWHSTVTPAPLAGTPHPVPVTDRPPNVAVSGSPFNQSSVSATPDSSSQLPPSGATLPRSLDGYYLASKDIENLFELFFRRFAILMPLLDAKMSPNAYYNASPLLFWTIVGIASRNYTTDPTAIGVLGPKIQTMAFMSLTSGATLQGVQSLLLLLYWPFPKASTGVDPSFALCGSMLHMALQIGLHLPPLSQEYSKVRIQLNQADIKERAETWGYCMLIYQRALLFKGTPAIPIMDIPHDYEQRKSFRDSIPARLSLELKLQGIVSQGCIAIAQNGLRCMSPAREKSLDTLIHIFHSQIESAALEVITDLDRFYTYLASISILSFTFYKSPTAQDPPLMFKLSTAACNLIECLDKLDRDGIVICAAGSATFYFALMWACHILLRILKTSFAKFVDIAKAKTMFLLGVSLHKRMSLQNDDLPSRNGSGLTQLWNSTKAFRRPDGSEFVELRIRSRLVGSVLLDGIVWWREEFGGTAGVYPTPLPDRRPDSTPNTETANTSKRNAEDGSIFPTANLSTFPVFADDPLLNDLGWSIGDDVFSSMWFDAAPTAY